MQTLQLFAICLLMGTHTSDGQPLPLFPYGQVEGDTLLPKGGDVTSELISLPDEFTFFNVSYGGVFVSVNGALSFGSPLGNYGIDYPQIGSRVAILPFFVDIDTDDELFGNGDVMYRVLRPSNQSSALFERANSLVRNTFEQRSFEASWMLVVTWGDVGYPLSAQLNTFQCILVTDGNFSSVFFLYGTVTWYGAGLDQGGKAAQIGFSAGNGEYIFEIEKSGSESALDVDTISNIGQPGVWVFRVDTETVIESVCGRSTDLVVSPRVIPMMGGSTVVIAGPCYDLDSPDIRCDFGGKIVHGVVTSYTKVMCVSPAAFTLGFIDVRLSLDGGESYDHFGDIAVSGDLPFPVSLALLDAPPGSDHNLTVTWDPEALPGVRIVDIVVYEFTEDDDDFDNDRDADQGLTRSSTSTRFNWTQVYTLATGIPLSSGRFNFVNDLVDDDHFLGRMTAVGGLSSARMGPLGIVQSSLNTTIDSLERRAIWSDIHPLNWLYPVDTAAWCRKWASQQTQSLSHWLHERPPCPCLERQARQDTAAFVAINGDETGACFEAAYPSPAGVGQMCCYDGRGYLIGDAADDAAGSGFSQRRHNRVVSTAWSEGRGPVPALSHYLADTLPYLQCCGDSSYPKRMTKEEPDHEELCDLYRTARPPQTCSDYRPPRPAAAFGDPHFLTFDGLNYTFNGYGEFTLANFSDGRFILQGRSVPLSACPNGTVFEAFAFKSNESDVIHIEPNADSGGGMTVYVRRDGRSFEELSFGKTRVWHLSHATMTYASGNESDGDDESESLMVVFDSGISVKITPQDGALAVLVMTQVAFKGKTRGLLGTWDDDSRNDLQTPGEVTLPSNSTMMTIFEEFGSTWEVTPDLSLFYYRTGVNQSTYTNQSYRPSLLIPDLSLANVSEVCDDNEFCAFDWLTTGSAQFARKTLLLAEQFATAKENLTPYILVTPTPTLPIPVTCPELSIPNGGARYESNHHLVGGNAHIICDPCYELVAESPPTLTCLPSGSWSGSGAVCRPREPKCPEMSPPANGMMQVERCHVTTPITFFCDIGYTLSGRSVIECLVGSGEWTAHAPTCQKDGRTEKTSQTTSDKSTSTSTTTSSMEFSTIGGVVAGILFLIIAVVVACVVVARRHKKRRHEQELKKRKEKMWNTSNAAHNGITAV